MQHLGTFLLNRPHAMGVIIAVALLALPLVVWRDLLDITDQSLRRQSVSLDTVLSSVGAYYSENVADRITQTSAPSQVIHDYHSVDGAVPNPATLLIELGEIISENENVVAYRFVSDYPFENRPTHDMTPSERDALQRFRTGHTAERMFFKAEDTALEHSITMVAPVVMQQACVDCHNSHPESTRTNWQVGDVRGVEAITVNQPLAVSLGSFKWLLLYMLVAGSFGFVFARYQDRLAGRFRALNSELAQKNDVLAGISDTLSRYLSPQIYRSIFSGETTATLTTKRKKLTVFFSDIKDFTEITETLQPEELTALLNEYFTEMSTIADRHGATIDKFIGDAIVAFFGDPDTRGTAEDARACVRMALDMQARLEDLALNWRARGLERPFRARIGINTGFCNVGNFGSDRHMDYTIIGAEANLAARMESIAEPGGIVMSYETYTHVRDLIDADPLPPQRFKGIARDVVPYTVHMRQAERRTAIHKSGDGTTLTVDLTALDPGLRDRLRTLLSEDSKPTSDTSPTQNS